MRPYPLIETPERAELVSQRYWEIDPAQVLRFAREDLGDFTAYLRAVAVLVGDGEIDATA